MPFPAIGAAIVAGASAAGTAIGGMTLAGLAAGATIVGTGMQLIGMATGSKTLQKIGMGMSLAGGIGQGGLALANGSKGASSISSLLAGSNVDDVLSSSVKGSTSASDIASKSILKSPAKGAVGDILGYSADASGYAPATSAMASYAPETRSALQGISDTLTRYSIPMNIIGGMGEAYMTKQMIDQRDRMQDKDIRFKQNEVDRRSQMPGQFPVSPSVTFNPNAYNGLLRGQ